MKLFGRVSAICVASVMLAGAAAAADMPYAASDGYRAAPHHSSGYVRDGFGDHRHHSRHRGSLLGLGHRSTAHGRARQRHRTHLDRCRNVPSRC